MYAKLAELFSARSNTKSSRRGHSRRRSRVRSAAGLVAEALEERTFLSLAVATQGTGVVESFLGLLQTTWQSLNQQHSLDKKFGFESDAFVQMVANKLGANAPVLRLINTRLGGAPAAARSQGGGA